MKIYKNWDKMSEEDKKIEKFGAIMMIIVFILIIILLLLALSV